MMNANNLFGRASLLMLMILITLTGLDASDSTALAQEFASVDYILADSYGKDSKAPVVKFAQIDVAADLAFLGKYFFGGVLTEKMAKFDAGRYLYFDNGYSKLWYYPSSGAYEWIRSNPPVASDFELTDDVMLALNEQALSLIISLRREGLYPGEALEFVKSSKTTAYAGILNADTPPPITYLRRIDMIFQQVVAGIPSYHGSRASISYCGDMEVCRIKVLSRTITDVQFVELLGLPEIKNSVRLSMSKMDGAYYVDHVDAERSVRVGYAVYSKNFSQRGAVPYMMVPVCRSKGGSHSSYCEIRSEIAAPLVSDPDEYTQARFAKIRSVESWASTILEQPSICNQSPNLKECAP